MYPILMLATRRFPLSLTAAIGAVAAVCALQFPSRAATFTVNGFTGAFAPSEWTISNTTGSTANTTITATDSTLFVPAGPASSTSFIFDTNKLATTYPGFASGTVKFNWNWTAGAGVTPYFGGNLYTQTNNLAPVLLTKYIGPTPAAPGDLIALGNFTTAGANASFTVAAGDTFLFRLQSPDPGFGSTAVISGFSFTGTDGAPSAAAPAPLPVLGAAAAFGFGRRIRRRLSANASNKVVA